MEHLTTHPLWNKSILWNFVSSTANSNAACKSAILNSSDYIDKENRKEWFTPPYCMHMFVDVQYGLCPIMLSSSTVQKLHDDVDLWTYIL